MALLPTPKTGKNGNKEDWYCKFCTIKNDEHNRDCPDFGKVLLTKNEIPSNLVAITPSYCRACGCTYSNGCPEHGKGVSLVKGAK